MANGGNPFTPDFGEVPAHLAGRMRILHGFERALTNEGRRPELTTILSGPRGIGKTTLLAIISDRAGDWGWLSVDTTARNGMLDDIEIQVARKAAHMLPRTDGTRLSGIGIPGVVEVDLEAVPEKAKSNWRSRMMDVLDALERNDTGLLITVDEVDPELDELEELVTVYQHFVREGRKVALVMAGLPNRIGNLLDGRSSSFLRRAQHVELGRVSDADIETALRRTVESGGRVIAEEGLREAVRAIEGFPYLMQLVGFRAWDVAPEDHLITSEAMDVGIRQGRSELESRVFDATWRDLSGNDRKFLEAMLPDGAESRIADLRERLGWSSSLTAQYRRRLVQAGVIGRKSRGVVAFELPYFREYLEEMIEG